MICTRAGKIRRAWVLLGAASIAVALAACHRKSTHQLLAKGDEALKTQNLGEAEQNYQQAAKQAPNNTRVHLALGNLYDAQHQLGPAQQEYMKAIELDPHNGAAHAALAKVYAKQKLFDASEEHYRAAVAINPRRPEYRMALGATLQQERKLAEAESEYKTAIGLDPKNADAHVLLANLLNTQPNRAEEARREYAEAKALKPSLAVPGELTTSVAPAAAAPAGPKPALGLKIKELNKRFLLTKNSPVYHDPSTDSAVVANVFGGKYVKVTGMTGDWLRIKLKTGAVGFIPTSAVE